MEKLTILDKYITKQLIETFLMGVIIFTSIMFASDTFVNLAKQVSSYGISFNTALMIIYIKTAFHFCFNYSNGGFTCHNKYF